MPTNSAHRNVYESPRGLNEQIVRDISACKGEPQWMTEFRLKALSIFEQKPMPSWGPDLSPFDPHELYCYVKPLDSPQHSWDDVPESIRKTFEKLGIPQAEQKFLAGVGAQYESEMIYKQLKKEWRDAGVIFTDMNSALFEFPELFRSYFATIVPSHDNKFAALNSAVWSGGSFMYIPEGVHVSQPLQAYFRLHKASMGQFERTLIIADIGSYVHYVEGCSAPVYQVGSLHSAVVEIMALPGSHVRYTTIQNWSENVYNLVTKRAVAKQGATVEWVDGNFGSRVTMKYPSIVLDGKRARGQIISIAVAKRGQTQDTGAKIIHSAPYTTSHVVSKSLSSDGGCASYRGLLKVCKGAHHVRSRVQCDALIFDGQSRTATYPLLVVGEHDVDVGHEASVSKIGEEQLFYLKSRGLSQQAARALIAVGFIDLFIKELPMEYAVEINRLIAHAMEDSIG